MRYVRVEFAFPPSVRHPMHGFLDDGDGWRTELLTWRRLPDETLVTLFRVVAPRERYLERLRTVEPIDRFETAPGDDAFYLKAYERLGGPLETFLGAFVDTEFLSVPPIVYRSGGRLSFGLIGPPNQLRDVLAAVPDPIEITVERIGSYGGGRQPAGVELTKRQREALRAARRVGYYDVPRTGSVADVAEAIGCSPSTAGAHLRKGEAALVGAHLDG
ncbi:helix-turn-helix domain-containing protein [Halorubrum amylolyticum]|uniref:helix-turn-helix domain-containing protein n=1 Tax=Halorubrum amylolyticum TaxID=2508724 RepID=UPI0010089EBD|nr:helix-turn-helix domain-containing protein [Halorubrum amylolyticum]